MKFKGKMVRLRPRAVEVTLGQDENGEPVTVRLRAPKLGAVERVHGEIPVPQAPQVGVQKDERGRTMRDAQGRPIVIRNEADPGYTAAVAERSKLLTVALILDSLDGEVEFMARRESSSTPADYYRAVLREMEAAGVDVATFRRLDDVVGSLLTPQAEREEAAEAREALGAPPLPEVPEGK